MSNIDPDRLDIWLSKAEGRVARLKRKTAAKRKLDKHLSRLIDYSKSKTASNAERVKIQEKLASIQKKIASGDVVPTLDEVEQMVDEIYGDQSKNETFYFQRRRRQSKQASPQKSNWYDKTSASPDLDGKPWYKVPLEEAEEHSDQMYGDQSANETYYFERREEGGEDLPRWAQKDADRDVEAYNVAPDQYRLKERKFDAQNVLYNWYEEQKTAKKSHGSYEFQNSLFRSKHEAVQAALQWLFRDYPEILDKSDHEIAIELRREPVDLVITGPRGDNIRVVDVLEGKTASSFVPGLEEDGFELGDKDYTKNPGEWWKEDRQSSQNAGNWYSKKKMRRR